MSSFVQTLNSVEQGPLTLLATLNTIKLCDWLVSGTASNSTQVSVSARRHIRPDLVVDTYTPLDPYPSRVPAQIQKCLLDYASMTDLLELERTKTTFAVLQSSTEAEASAGTRLSGEMGLQSAQFGNLILPINRLLRARVGHGDALAWRCVGLGGSGRPDFQLVFTKDCFTARPVETCLAVVEVKTLLALSDAAIERVLTTVATGQVISAGTGQTPGLLYRSGPGSRGERNQALNPIEQTITEMYTHNVQYAILENNNHFMLFHRPDKDQHRIRIDPDLIRRTAQSLPHELWRSPIGLVFGISLLAMKDHELSSHGNLEVGTRGTLPLDSAAGNASGNPALQPTLYPPVGPARADSLWIDVSPSNHNIGSSRSNTGPHTRPNSFPELDSKKSFITSTTWVHRPTSYLMTPPATPKEVPVHKLGARCLSIGIPASRTTSLLSSATTISDLTDMVSPFYGPISLSDFGLEVNTLPRLLPSDNPTTLAHETVELQAFRGHGALWNTFEVNMTISTKEVVCKLSDVQSSGSSQDTLLAKQSIFQEANAFLGPLSALQGSVVPLYLGLWGSLQKGSREVWCSLYQDAGRPLPDSCALDARIRTTIRRLYSSIHNVGVVHGDVAWRHILTPGDDQLYLVDFDRSQIRHHDDSARSWSQRCRAEMEVVDDMLNTALYIARRDGDLHSV